jgi:hypothetical protein
VTGLITGRRPKASACVPLIDTVGFTKVVEMEDGQLVTKLFVDKTQILEILVMVRSELHVSKSKDGMHEEQLMILFYCSKEE